MMLSSPEDSQSGRVDVVIVNYKSTDLLIQCLNSIQAVAGDLRYNVLVEDNSEDDDVDRVLERFPSVRIEKNRKNIGFAKGVNKGLAGCTAPYVLILNPDTLVGPGFFEAMLSYMEGHPDIGILGPRILDQDGSVQGSARGFPTPLTAFFGRRSIFSKLFPNNPITRENVRTMDCDGQTPMEVDWVSGACMVVRLAAFKSVGYLDERFFMYWEDTDWCRRMWANGWRVVYLPSAFITHFVGGSSERNVFGSVLAFHQSSYKLFAKYLSPSQSFVKPFVFVGLIFRCLFVYAFQALSRGIRFLKSREVSTWPLRTAEPEDGRIRIVRFIARLNIGGPAIHVHLLTRDLDRARFSTTLITGKISPKEGDMGYLFGDLPEKAIFIPELQREISPLMDIRAFRSVLRVLHLKKPHIVDTHTAKAGTTARLAAMYYNLFSRRKIRTVHTFHGHVFEGYFSKPVSGLYVWIERLLALQTDVIIAISPSQKADLARKFRIAPAEKIRSIPLGFDLTPFLSSGELKGRFKRRIGFPEDAALVGIIGRLVPIKNHRLFLEAARVCIQEKGVDHLRFAVIGDGEMRMDLEKHCRELGISSYVHFTGWLRDLTEVYADLDVLALTSDNEGTPVSIIEAMAASVPVIATDAGGVIDLLGKRVKSPQNGGFSLCERGVLCAKGDPWGFSNGLAYLLQNEDHEREALALAARSFVKRRFSAERLLFDMEDLYRSLAERRCH